MVRNEVWAIAGAEGFLCIECLERRLGRRLQRDDFTSSRVNDPADPWHTARLLDRLTS